MTVGAKNQQSRRHRMTAIRMLRVLVLLRQRPHTVGQLAQMRGCCERTIVRDLYALQSVPFPIESRFPPAAHPHRQGVRAGDQNEWFLGEMPAWPRGAVAPVADVAPRTSGDLL